MYGTELFGRQSTTIKNDHRDLSTHPSNQCSHVGHFNGRAFFNRKDRVSDSGCKKMPVLIPFLDKRPPFVERAAAGDWLATVTSRKAWNQAAVRHST
jgi:hypothetical protein